MRRLVVMAAIACVLVASAKATAASPHVRFERAADGRGLVVHMHSKVDAPSEAIEGVLLDVEAYPQWVPRLRDVRSVISERDHRLFEGVLDLPWPLADVRETVDMTRR